MRRYAIYENMSEVADGIHKIEIKLPFPQTPSINLYLIMGDTMTLIDSGLGYGVSKRAVSKYLQKIGLALENLSLVINTHEHPEHIGGNFELKSANEKLRIAAHEIAVEAFKYYTEISPAWYEGADEVVRKELLDSIESFKNQFLALPSLGAEKVRDGDILDLGGFKLEILHTPGHSQGHICLLERDKKILFSGDNVLGSGTPYIGTRRASPIKGNMTDFINSLRKLLGVDADLLLPSHGDMSRDVRGRIEDTMNRKLARENDVLRSLERGAKRPAEITREVYGSKFVDFLKGSVIAYLEKLEREEKVERFDKEESGETKTYFRLRQ